MSPTAEQHEHASRWAQLDEDNWVFPGKATISHEDTGYWLYPWGAATEPRGPFPSVLAAMLVSEEA